VNKEFEISFDNKSIAVSVGDGVFRNFEEVVGQRVRNRPLYFIIDSLIYEKYINDFSTILKKSNRYCFILAGGKSNKTFATAMTVFADLEGKNISRDSVIVAVGGGVIGDLAGFIASCWYRGMDLIHIPTTLLAAVDSSLGGKTALNFRHTVNAIGTYHHPLAILVDTSVLMELPEREISSGFAEVIKYGVLGSEEILSLLDSPLELTKEGLAEVVALSLSQKARFVTGDVKESANRLFLNFGHTIGHAIEFSTILNGEEMIRHGEGVSLGMVAVFRICASLSLIEDSQVERLRELLKKFGLPTEFNSSDMSQRRETLVDLIVERAFKDKKRTQDGLRLVVIRGWGHPELHFTSDPNLIRIGVEEVIK
jgi:3-dehydroquinate synthase